MYHAQIPRAIALTKGPHVLTYHAELDLALTYALRRPKLALECAWNALRAAIQTKRPDLAYRANELVLVLGGGL